MGRRKADRGINSSGACQSLCPLPCLLICNNVYAARHGNVVYLEDVLDAAGEKTGKIIEEKSPDLPDKDEVAAAVGVGAVVWSMLYNSRIKDVTFSWKKAVIRIAVIMG